MRLTGLANRRQLLADLERLCADRSSRPSSCCSIWTASRATTTLRPPGGDACSPASASKLATVPSAEDSVYRLGGDEFCLVATVARRRGGAADRPGVRGTLGARARASRSGARSVPCCFPDEADDASQRAAGGRRASLRAEVLAAGESERTMAALLAALSIREPELEAPRAASDARRASRKDAGAPSRRARRARAGRAAPRSRQARGAGRDPPQARAARRARVGVRSPAHHRRRAHPPRVPGVSQRREDRPLEPRELGRQRVSRRPRRRETPLASRIIRVCSAYIAMISDRPYRAALSTRRRSTSSAPRRHGVRPDGRPRASSLTCATGTKPSGRVAGGGHTAAARPRSSVDRATDFESVRGGSTPPGAMQR